MKKLLLGLALTAFLGTYSVSAMDENPPQEKAKTEATKKDCKAEKNVTATTEKKACCSKTTASTDKAACSEKSKTTASTK